MPCYKPLSGYKDPETGGLIFKRPTNAPPQTLEVACSQCLGCRLDRTRMWSARIIHHSTLSDPENGNSFVTLTYRSPDECTPEQYNRGHFLPDEPHKQSLNKADVQRFIKRLRKHYSDRKISYYQCGEYGDENGRPHYHLCLFNVSFDDERLYYEKEGIRVYTSATLEKLWPYGFSTSAPLTYDNAAYTAGYVQKKITGKKAQDHYLRCDEYGVATWLQPEYSTMSLKPAIGKEWYEKYKNDVYPSDETPIPGYGIIPTVPRYYDKILERQDPDIYELVKTNRRKFIQEHADDFTPHRLEQKYKVAQAKQALKRREL